MIQINFVASYPYQTIPNEVRHLIVIIYRKAYTDGSIFTTNAA